MLFRMSEDGRTQVNLALVRAVAVVPAMTGANQVGGFQVRAELQGAASHPVVLKTFPVPTVGDVASEKGAAQKAMDYLAGLPTRIALEGVSELVKVLGPTMALFDTLGFKKSSRFSMAPQGKKAAAKKSTARR